MAVHDAHPKVTLSDKDDDTDEIRVELRAWGAVPEILTKRNRRLPYTVSRAVDAMRNQIERFFNLQLD